MFNFISKEEFEKNVKNQTSLSKSKNVVKNEALDAYEFVKDRGLKLAYCPIFDDTRFYNIVDCFGEVRGSMFVGGDKVNVAFEHGDEKINIVLSPFKSYKPGTFYQRDVRYVRSMANNEETYIDDFTGEVKPREGELALIIKEISSKEIIDSFGRVLRIESKIEETDPEFMNLKQSTFDAVAEYFNTDNPIVAQFYVKTPEDESLYGELYNEEDGETISYLPKVKMYVDDLYGDHLCRCNIEDFIRDRLQHPELNYPRTYFVDSSLEENEEKLAGEENLKGEASSDSGDEPQ